MQGFWPPIAGAAIAAVTAFSLWMFQERRKTHLERLQALHALDYLAQTLSECLPYGSEDLKHVDMAIVNAHVRRLLEIKESRDGLRQLHSTYLKWRLDAYKGLSIDSDELRTARQGLDQIHAQTLLQIQKLAR